MPYPTLNRNEQPNAGSFSSVLVKGTANLALTLGIAFSALFSHPVVHAEVVSLAPDFAWLGAGNQTKTLKNLRGQAVVIVFAKSQKESSFRKQAKWLKEIYQQFAGKGVIFVAALRDGEGPVKSDIPFVLARDGAAVADAYGVSDKFALAVIGRDGNLDYLTRKVCTGERVRDVIQNSYTVQAAPRK